MDAATKRIRFGRAVRAARLSAGLSQAKLSQAIGRDQGIVSDYEAGKSEPGVEAVASLEEALSLDPGSLSRYLGWIPVDPADAPEPPEVLTTRTVMGADTAKIVGDFARQMSDIKLAIPDLGPAVEAIRRALDGMNLHTAAGDAIKNLELAIPPEAIYQFKDLQIVPFPAEEMARLSDLAVTIAPETTTEADARKQRQSKLRDTFYPEPIKATTVVHPPAVTVEERLAELEATVQRLIEGKATSNIDFTSKAKGTVSKPKNKPED